MASKPEGLRSRLRNLVSHLYRRAGRRRWFQELAAGTTRGFRNAPRVIRHGEGAGLTFNPHGGALGFALGTTEEEEQRTLARVLQPGNVFYDVGANKGFYAVIAARLVGPEGAVHAFEPFPESVHAIEANARANGFENVTVWPVGVSDVSGVDTLIVEGGDFEYRLSTSLNAGEADKSRAITVEIVRLDELVADGRLPPPDVVMIDVEGAEVAVLRGMTEIVKRHRPTILCEIHWLQREIDEILVELLEPLGYVATQLDGTPRPTEVTRYHLLLQPT